MIRSESSLDRLAAALIAVVTGLSFLSCLRFGFLQWDDAANVVANPHLAPWNLDSLRWMWATHFQGPYQPLTWMSLSLDAHLWGSRAAGWHGMNLFLHAVNAVLFFSLLRRLGLRTASAMMGALLWSVHPLRVESVVWVTERRDVLSGFFALLSLHATVRRRMGLALAVFAAALLSKATAVGVVWGMIAIDLLPTGRLPLDPRGWLKPACRGVWLEKLPFIALALAVGLFNLAGYQELGILQTRYSLADRLTLFLSNASFYLQKIVWPHPLLPYYHLPVNLMEIARPLAVHGALTLVVTGFLVNIYRRAPGGLIAWVCFWLILAPMSGLGQNGQQMAADRYTYLAALPLSALVGFILEKRPAFWRFPVWAGIGLLAILTFRQTLVWRDDVMLWRYTLHHAPDTYIAHSNLATLAMRENRKEEAESHFKEAVRLRPTDVESRLNWAVLLGERGQLAQAEALYQEALAVQPGYGPILNNLANIRVQQGRFKEAESIFREVVLKTPNIAEAWFNLGALLMRRGKQAEAQSCLRKALSLQPSLASRLPR